MKETFKKLFIMMHIRNFNFGTTGQAKSTYDAACLLVNSENSYLLTGANDFNGIRWFNKEKMDATLWYGFAAIVMYSPRILREQVYRLYRTLVAAKDHSEFQCAKFTEAVKPAKPSKLASLSGGKTASEKATAKTSVEDSKNSKRK
jgi:hypothetical protein